MPQNQPNRTPFSTPVSIAAMSGLAWAGTVGEMLAAAAPRDPVGETAEPEASERAPEASGTAPRDGWWHRLTAACAAWARATKLRIAFRGE